MSPAAAQALEARRKAGIRAIKCAQRQLGLDDGTYRALLEGQTGKTSATLLTVHEQGVVLDYMRRHGAPNPKRAARDGGRKRLAPANDRAALMRKVHALLNELHRVTGEPHSLNYADAICKRNGWAERVDFCAPGDLHSLVGALARTLRAKAAHPAPAAQAAAPAH